MGDLTGVDVWLEWQHYVMDVVFRVIGVDTEFIEEKFKSLVVYVMLKCDIPAKQKAEDCHCLVDQEREHQVCAEDFIKKDF